MNAVLAALVLATSAGHPEVVLDCAAFGRLPDGTWLAVKDTQVEIRDRERKTLDMFRVSEGTRSSAGNRDRPPPRDSMSALADQLFGGADVVAELDKRCR